MKEASLLEIVSELNQVWFDKTDDADLVPFELSANGYASAVIFMGQSVWCSENNTSGSMDLEEGSLSEYAAVFAEIVNNVAIVVKHLSELPAVFVSLLDEVVARSQAGGAKCPPPQ